MHLKSHQHKTILIVGRINKKKTRTIVIVVKYIHAVVMVVVMVVME